MASIPLPELDAHPPNMLEEYARAVSLKGMMQQQQQQQAMAPLQQQQAQQQVEAGGVELQQKKQALKDQQAMTESMQQWDPKDVEGIVPLMIKHGASAQAVFGMKSQITKQLQEKATLDKDTLANNAAKNDQLLGALTAASEGDDATLAQRIQGAAQDQLQRGNLDPQHAQQLQQLLAQPPDAIRKALPIIEKTLQGQKEQFTQALDKKKADQGAWHSDGQGLLVNTDTKETIQGNQPVDQSAMMDWLRKNPGKGPSDFVVWKAQHSPSVIVQSGGNSDSMVDMVGSGRVDLATAVGRMAPAAKESFMKSLSDKYPEYSQATYGTEKAVLKSATSGKIADNLTAFNTAIDHAKQLRDAADALDNGDVHALNKIGNAAGYQFGSDKTTNFNVIKSALSGEISKVFKGGQATDAEIKEVQTPFDAANSPAQLKGAIDTAVRLMNSKRTALKQQVEKGQQGKANFGDESGASGGGQSATGPNGHKIVVKDGKWVDAETGNPI